ncbi:LuxR C-terminal-related transcriptional regulator [Enterobacteriaceae bacterium H18W14]|uniref:LuxR C-terminal-related transcriptional regulator n=1 Tax=Dryocola boscaweniae TaxID=2925397 RepID=UPI0022F072C9|nr:LuxR C-terminal-related transcriptional regulator [Dryocola boscaweniae]MCT4716442.1 LuxR C-terminal-related transcriptional regulator [Dryocola boscaweniae]
MKFDVLSDNYYYCEGMKSAQNTVHYILTPEDVDKFYIRFVHNNPLIIAVENMYLRGYIIEICRLMKSQYIVLLEDMVKNGWFEIDNVIYSAMDSSQHHIRKVITSPVMNKNERLTPRERDILPHVHLSNTTIATKLNLSQKTASGYKIVIKRKLKMKFYNSLALTRMKNAIMCSDTTAKNNSLTRRQKVEPRQKHV